MNINDYSMYLDYLSKQGISTMTPMGGQVDPYGGMGQPQVAAPAPVTNPSYQSSVVKGTTDSGGGIGGAATQISTGVSDAVNSIIMNNQWKKYANKVLEQKMTIPTGVYEGESIARNQATQGLPGVETMRQGLFNSLPAMTNKAQEVGQPTSVLKALSDSYTQVEAALNSLNIQDAGQKLTNRLSLMHFLSSVKAPAEQRVEDFDISKTLAAEQARMQGKMELLKGASSASSNISGGIGSIVGMGI